MHVTPFSAATILVFATASPLHAQGSEVFGGYSVNADYVQNRPAIPSMPKGGARESLLHHHWLHPVFLFSIVGSLTRAMRSFRGHRGLLALVVLSLALGIGGTTVVFGVVDTLLIHPVPFAHGDQLVEVWTETLPDAHRTPGVSADVVRVLGGETDVFAAVEGYQFGAGTITADGEPELVAAPRVTTGLFHMLGAVPLAGRLFDAADADAGSLVAMISEGLWNTRFGRASAIVGRSLTVDGESHTIVGVLPASFAFPERKVAVWRPIVTSRAARASARVQVVARLRDHVSRTLLDERLRALSARLISDSTLARDRMLISEDLIQRRWGRQQRVALYMMLGAMGLVLLVACVNVTNLLLARATARRGEFALLGALGASRAQVARQVLLESVVLTALSGAGGALLAKGLLATLFDLLPPALTMLSAASGINWRSALFAAALSAVTCVIVGVIPALRVARLDLA